MQTDPAPASAAAGAAAHRRASRLHDALLAGALALLLSAVWTLNDWPQLRWLVLPDSDDMMRLAQIRDLVAGQRWDSWTQARLGLAGGAPMHWSRIADLAPAAIILALRPMTGTYGAELAALLLVPAALFAVYLFLSARIARRLGAPAAAPVAAVLAAIAYPANSLFLPGRIDHHGLQIVLVLGAILALSGRATLAAGAAAGLAAAVSFGIGLETAPQVAALTAALFLRWVAQGRGAVPLVRGFAGGLLGGTVALLALARPSLWSDAWCDAFTPASATATIAGALALAAVTAWTPRDWKVRLACGTLLGAAALATTLMLYPVCLSGPYGPVDPLVRTAFIANIVEAQGVFADRLLGVALPSAGLMLVASAVAAWLWWTRPAARARLLPIALVLLLSDAVILVQLRGAYLGSAVAAPLLAQWVLAARGARAWRLPALVAAWSLSAGMLWLLLPMRVEAWTTPAAPASAQVTRSCRAGDVWRQVDRYPPGAAMTSMALGAYLIGGTHHRAFAAGYHRNNAGNRLAYRFFLAPPADARTTAAALGVDYVLFCPDDFAEVEPARRYPTSLAAALAAGRAPGWLQPLPLRDTGLTLYRVR